jgi:hypothetical protein
MTDVGCLARYMGQLYDEGKAAGTVASYISAVRRVAVDLGNDRPEHGLLTAIGKGLKVLQSREDGIRIPIKALDIFKMYYFVRQAVDAGVVAKPRALIQAFGACLLGFAGMLRRSSMAGIKAEDLHIEETTTVVLRFEKGKDKVRRLGIRGFAGKWFKIHKAYLSQVVGKSPFEEALQFYGRDWQNLLLLLLERVDVAAPAGTRYQWHSLRAGGCTAAYFAGVDTFAIRKHGGWAAEKTLNSYVDFSHSGGKADKYLMHFVQPGSG